MRGYCSKTGIQISRLRALRRGYFRKIPGTDGETHLYRIYRCMMGRCFNRRHPNYRWYGAKGVGVCKEWQDDYEVFRTWACDQLKRLWTGNFMQASLDREDESGDYRPGNCRFITLQQNRIRGLHGDKVAGL